MQKSPKWLKPVVDYLPLVVFLVGYMLGGVMFATVCLLIATIFVLILSLAIERRVPMIPLATAVIVGVFGGLTLWLNDETFIKIKPTIVYLLFAAVLGAGLLFKKPLLKSLMGNAVSMDDAGWLSLSVRFAVFFLIMAVANEVVWRNFPTDLWVLWKFPGSVVITFGFMICQIGLFRRHRITP